MASFEDSDFTGMVVPTRLFGRLELGPLLGKGAAALVYRGLDRATGISFAVKVNRNEEALSTLIDVPDNYEMTVMRRLHQHPNVLGLLESAALGGFTCYITKLADRGDLLVFLQEQRALPEALARDLFSQLTSAVAYAHKNGVVHRDIKLENLLLTSDQAAQHGLRLLLADWGYAAPWSPGDPGLRDSCGSLHYCPPEILQGQLYEGRPTDVWSLGVVLYALLIGRFPFFGRDTNSIVGSIMQGLPIYPRPQAVTREAWSLLHQCLHQEPSFRPSLELIRSHAWMQGRERYQVARRSASDMGTHAILKQGEVRGISHSAPSEQSDTQQRIQADAKKEAAGAAGAESNNNNSNNEQHKQARPVRRKARARQKSQDHSAANGVAPTERRRQVSFSGEFDSATIVARHASRTSEPPSDLSKSTDDESSSCGTSRSKSGKSDKSGKSGKSSKSSSSNSSNSGSSSRKSSSHRRSSSSSSSSSSKDSPAILDSTITTTDHDDAAPVTVSVGRRMLGSGKKRVRSKKRCSSGVHFLHSSCGGQMERPEPASLRTSSGPSCVVRHSSADDRAARDTDAEQHRPPTARKTRTTSSSSASKKSGSRIKTGPRSLFATFTNASSKRSGSKRTSKSGSANSSASADHVRTRSRSMDLSAKCGVRTRSLSSVATVARAVTAKTTTSGEFPAVSLRQRSPRASVASAAPKEFSAQRKADDSQQRKADDSHPRVRSAVTAAPSETSYRPPSTSSRRHFLREHTSAVGSFEAHATESCLKPHTPLALEPCRTPRFHRVTPSSSSIKKNGKAANHTVL
eukprot:CAMPEP_0177664168 /NCGR_PEP_ID=MMETSP0447-20121125/20337_1 /TAXON_ID=0 /ORGANISM="Stygamoeba regulata, Strain BSH-02190019" /LENGTH=801 /DNA_ID=CAMNT_0019170097 /DNA_START=98 /DNA_END=2503 /DNA_ORIENTATION=+